MIPVTPVLLDTAFLAFRGREIEATATTGSDTPTVTVEPYEHDGYCRVLWDCAVLAGDLRYLDFKSRQAVTFEMPMFAPNGARVEWISLLSRKGARYRLFQTILNEEALAGYKPGETISVTIDVKKMPMEAELFLGIQMHCPDAPVEIVCPTLSWQRPEFLGLLDIRFENRSLQVQGWALDEATRSLPTRVALEMDGKVMDSVLARRPIPEDLQEAVPEGAYKFELSCFVPLTVSPPDLRLVLVETGTALAVPMDQDPAEEEETGAASPLPSVLPDSTVLGKLERVMPTEAVGWAICAEEPDAPVNLVLSVDGEPLCHTVTSLPRQDVAELHGGAGFAGFRFELPANLAVSDGVTVSVAPLVGKNRIRLSSQQIAPIGKVVVPSQTIVPRPADTGPEPKTDAPVSVIVLNRNCASLLEDMFTSAATVEDLSLIEWLIVDHNSTDDSRAVCEYMAEQGHRIRFLWRNGNFSFSDSNNYGAREASHDTLIFANNDLIFRAPFRRRLQQHLANPQNGLVGSSLYDYFDPDLADANAAPLQHLGVYFNPTTPPQRWFRPYEARLCDETADQPGTLVDLPAVTGAFMAMRKADFDALGGFDESYIYGLEDIDLCCKVWHGLGRSVICDNGLDIVHHRGFSRGKEKNVAVRQRNNNRQFNKTWGPLLRRQVRRDAVTRRSYWTGARPVVAFIVADAGDTTTAGEYFTALELGRALQKIVPVHLRFLTKDDWYDLSGVDILVVMVYGFHLSKVRKASPFLVTINWMRQWFDRWGEDPSLMSYDLLFASSQRAADYLAGKTGRDVAVLPIATNYDEFATKGEWTEALACDYCLTGNWVGTPRAIEQFLVPEAIDGTGAIYGANWEDTSLASISRGPVAYSDIVNVYASTKIAIDDANVATRDWGSCNSRVFDAMAAGCLLVTNGDLGVQELFGDLVPTFSDAPSLTRTLQYWLSHEEEREARVAELREIVRTKHTYDNRAETVHAALTTQDLPIRIAIKISARFNERMNWGDYHFAESLAKSLRKQGFIVTVDCLEGWNRGTAEADDVVIVLRGLSGYKPQPNQINILWLISHPRDIPLSELEPYDQIYVASIPYAERLRESLDVPVEVLLQCTDIDRFQPTDDTEVAGEAGKPLFVGNSRGIFRTVVKWSVELEADIDVYGGGWEQFLTDQRLRGTHIPNEVLSSYYERSTAVLCDHWDDMKREGFLSNRAFDVLACGGQLIVDDVTGIEDILPGGYKVFRTRDELGKILKSLKVPSRRERMKRVAWVRENHSFDARAEVLGAYVTKAMDRAMHPLATAAE